MPHGAGHYGAGHYMPHADRSQYHYRQYLLNQALGKDYPQKNNEASVEQHLAEKEVKLQPDEKVVEHRTEPFTARQSRSIGYIEPSLWKKKHHDQRRNNKSGAYLSPEQLAEAEYEQWNEVTKDNSSGTFDTELSHDMSADALQYHKSHPAMDYDSYITDTVVDPRTKDNQRRWANEMKPYSGTAMTVDNLDEAMEACTHFTGLRRPQCVVQDNPLQITERDCDTFRHNKKFYFQG